MCVRKPKNILLNEIAYPQCRRPCVSKLLQPGFRCEESIPYPPLPPSPSCEGIKIFLEESTVLEFLKNVWGLGTEEE